MLTELSFALAISLAPQQAQRSFHVPFPIGGYLPIVVVDPQMANPPVVPTGSTNYNDSNPTGSLGTYSIKIVDGSSEILLPPADEIDTTIQVRVIKKIVNGIPTDFRKITSEPFRFEDLATMIPKETVSNRPNPHIVRSNWGGIIYTPAIHGERRTLTMNNLGGLWIRIYLVEKYQNPEVLPENAVGAYDFKVP